MRMLKQSLKIATIGSLLVASLALADDKKPAPAAGAKAAAPPAMPEMKPSPELQQYKGMIGEWKCSGTGHFMGHDVKLTSTYKVAWDLDNYWAVGHLEAKAEGMPMAHKGTDYYGYDVTNKTFVSFGVDNGGDWMMQKSKGWEGDKQEWVGKGMMMGKEIDFKTTVTKKGDKEIAISETFGDSGVEQTCKK